MERGKQQTSEENVNLRLIQERVNLKEYAGDLEDDQLARDQANEYIIDCDRKIMGQDLKKRNRER